MDAISIIEYVFALTFIVYAAAAIIVWTFEFKKNVLYSELQKQMKILENLCISQALKSIRSYKIREDYRRASEKMENFQKLITANIFFL